MTVATTTRPNGFDGTNPKVRLGRDVPDATAAMITEAAERRSRGPRDPREVHALAAALAAPGTLEPRDADRDAPTVALARELLTRIAALDEGSDILSEHLIGEFPYDVASSAVGGYTLSFLDERISGLLDAAELDVAAAPRGHGWLIGMARFEAGSAERSLGDYAGWNQTIEWDAQIAEVIWDPAAGRVGVALEARSVSRRTYSAFGGNPVPGSFRDEREVRPYTDGRGTYAYAAAKAIATAGKLAGGEVVLARGVRLELSRYNFKGADPRSQNWKIVIDE